MGGGNHGNGVQSNQVQHCTSRGRLQAGRGQDTRSVVGVGALRCLLLVPVLVMVLVHFTLSDLSLALQSQGQYQDILSPKKYKKCSTDSKVTAIFLNLWILPVGGVALGRVCTQPVEQACLSTKSFL